MCVLQARGVDTIRGCVFYERTFCAVLSGFEPTTRGTTQSQSQHAANTAARLARCATPSRGRHGQDGSVAAMQPLLQKQLEKSVLFGTTFPAVAPAFSAAADAMSKIAVTALHLKTSHMVTAAGGALVPRSTKSNFHRPYMG